MLLYTEFVKLGLAQLVFDKNLCHLFDAVSLHIKVSKVLVLTQTKVHQCELIRLHS